MLLQNIFYNRAKNYVKIDVYKEVTKSIARVPVSVVYLFTCISRFNATIP
jgi:hypothetical protein